MEIGLIGLGKMGGNMARRWLEGGHRVVVTDVSVDAVSEAESVGAVGCKDVETLVSTMSAPRAVWMMLPSGEITEGMVTRLGGLLSRGDCIVDGGNTMYKDDIRRAGALREKGVHYVDQGTSGGVWGLKEGYSLMIGGETDVVERLTPAFVTLAPGAEKGWGHVGPVGSGHFVKMIHNGIEYGMMQAFAEGFEIMKAKKEFSLDLHQISKLWEDGSVVRSWLLELITLALEEDPNLSKIKGYVSDSGEGRWTVFESIDLDVPAPVIISSLLSRFVSRQENSFGAQMLAAMRNQFGGHAVKSK
jgi:6-phosphogluconate dehydrogenase